MRNELGLSYIPFIARLLFEDGSEFFLGLLDVGEGRALVHSIFPYATIARQNDVKLSVRVKDHLHFVEDIVPIGAILQINLRHVGVPWPLIIVIIDLILLFLGEFIVKWNVVKLLLRLHDL